jgi:hypothetical protein
MFSKSLVRNAVMRLSHGLDWQQRFEMLDRIKGDGRLEYFAQPRSRYWFLPAWLRKYARRMLGRNTAEKQVLPQRNAEADTFFNPMETYHTIESIFALLEDSGFRFIELNGMHRGSFHLPEPLFNDPLLQKRYEELELIDRLVVAENMLKPSNYYFAARRI